MKLDSLQIHSINVDLVPGKNWRELAKSGRKAMHYRVFGRATVAGQPAGVSFSLDALENGEIKDFGSAEVPAVASLLAKNDPNLDTAKLRYGPDGRPLVNTDGTPVYDEQPIVQDDGTEFDPAYGTLFFCTLHGGLRVTLNGVELERALDKSGAPRSTKGTAESPSVPVFDAQIEGVTVERRARAQGHGLLGRVKIGATAGGTAQQAARITAKAVADQSVSM